MIFFSTDVSPRDAVQTERAGVGIVVSTQLKHFIHDIKQISGRLMSISLRSKGRNLCFSSCYAPHSGHDTEKKNKFYDEVQAHARKAKGIHFLGGDFNARLHHRYQSEEPAMGPYIFGRGCEYLEQVSDYTLENRSLFVNYCLQDGLRILNTCFRKQAMNYCTFRENTTEHGPEWTPRKYAQLDYWLVAEKWQKNCRDVSARTDIFFPSDHYIVEAKVGVRLVADKNSKSRAPKFRQPTQAEFVHYNELVTRRLNNLVMNSETAWSEISNCIIETAKQTLTKIDQNQRQEYLSQETWQKIVERQQAHESGNLGVVQELSNKIKNLARRDKRRAVFDSIREIPDQREKWTGVKKLKKEQQPRFIHMKGLQGEYVAPRNRAEAIATYLQDKHWTNDNNTLVDRTDRIQDFRHLFDLRPFTMTEFDAALSSSKKNKQPGPDNVIMELFSWLNSENKTWFLRLVNLWWSNQYAPEDLFFARVVPIYKKGDTDDPANYRPISLLNSFYKLYMILIRQRLQVVLEDTLTQTQYGFRPSRSTSHALFLTRRMQDIAEQQGSNLIITFLDWKQAFDKVQHDKLYNASNRLGFHDHFIQGIKNCYRNPCFFVEDEFGKSLPKRQRSGIRQGCPLSPYLFVLVMSVIDNDVNYHLDRRTLGTRKPGISFDRIYYADDTVLLATNTYSANRILWAVERVSLQFGLKLNRGKCSYIAMNGNNNLRFADGTKLCRCTETTYLGHHITRSMNMRQEIGYRMQQTMAAWTKLKPFWKASNCTVGWRLRVYQAVIQNKLIYGLETVHLTQAMLNKINAFQLRGLRSILNLEPTFVNRRNTNEFVLRMASEKAGHEVKLFSELLLDKRVKLSGHLLRATDSDPMRQVVYSPQSANAYPIGKRRVGAPRQQWRHFTHKHIWNKLTNGWTDYLNTDEQNRRIHQMALARQF